MTNRPAQDTDSIEDGLSFGTMKDRALARAFLFAHLHSIPLPEVRTTDKETGEERVLVEARTIMISQRTRDSVMNDIAPELKARIHASGADPQSP